MRFIAASIVGLTLTLGGAVQPPTTGGDEVGVRAVVRRYAEAREKRDPAAVATVFTSDADHLVSSGEWRLGRDRVVTGSVASTESGGKRELVVERVRFLTKDTAVADARYLVTGRAEGDRRMWSTFVLVRDPAGWKIAAIRNMLPAPTVARAPANPLN